MNRKAEPVSDECEALKHDLRRVMDRELALLNPWQPIDTAPTDHGTTLLLFAPPNVVAVATKMTDWWEIEPLSSDDYYANKIVPTHWMPLPAPPR